MIENPIYLGDGVYGTLLIETQQIMLTTGHHERAQADNVIYLDAAVLDAFELWTKTIVEDRE